MNSFVFSYPTKVYFGNGAAKQALGAELGAYKKIMLAYGVASAKANGTYGEIRGLLEELGKEIVDFGGITPNPKYSKAQDGAALARSEGVDFILALAAAASPTAARSSPHRRCWMRTSGTMSTSRGSSPPRAYRWAS